MSLDRAAARKRYVVPSLIGLHAAAFLILRFIDVPKSVMILFVLRNDSLHPAAILLHPFGVTGVAAWICVLIGLAILGLRLETNRGGGFAAASYVLGNLLAGVVFFLFAAITPEHSALTLSIPAGGMSAWWMSNRTVTGGDLTLFGNVLSTDRAIHYVGLAVFALVFAYRGPAATAWLVATAAGACAAPLMQRIRAHRPNGAS